MSNEVCLTMIVKNEAHVIERCLDSVKRLITCAVIVDTGSTDDTIDIIKQWSEDNVFYIDVFQDEWVNFAHNRNQALAYARDMQRDKGYALHMDADDILINHPRSLHAMMEEEADGYKVPVDYSGTRYDRLLLTRLDRPWYWKGAVHEALYLDEPHVVGELAQPVLKVIGGGARSNDPNKYLNDAELLLAELETNPNDPRTVFYIAQSYRDAGDNDKALLWYAQRIRLEGWVQEKFYAAYQLGVCMERAGLPPEAVSDAYLRAYEIAPHRVEPLVAAARVYRAHDRFSMARLLASQACRCPDPTQSDLFVETESYDVDRFDELSLACYWAGDPQWYKTGLNAAIKARNAQLGNPRLEENVRLWMEKLGIKRLSDE